MAERLAITTFTRMMRLWSATGVATCLPLQEGSSKCRKFPCQSACRQVSRPWCRQAQDLTHRCRSYPCVERKREYVVTKVMYVVKMEKIDED